MRFRWAASAYRVPDARRIILTKSLRRLAMPIETTNHIWHNGELIPWEKAQIHVMSHVIHYGSSVFEGIRCYKQQDGEGVFRLNEHSDRLMNFLDLYRIQRRHTLTRQP